MANRSLIILIFCVLACQGLAVNSHLDQTSLPTDAGSAVGAVLVDSGEVTVVGYLGAVVGYDIRSGVVEWSQTLGLNHSLGLFLWTIIPNTPSPSQATGVVGSLSNGTVFGISSGGELSWSLSVSNDDISVLEWVGDQLVAGGDDGSLYWLSTGGTLVSSVSVGSSSVTVVHSYSTIVAVGTSDGQVVVYNGTTQLWTSQLSLQPVLGLVVTVDKIIASSFKGSTHCFDLITGAIQYSRDLGDVTLKGLNQGFGSAVFYAALTNGTLLSLENDSGEVLWRSKQLTGYVTNLALGEVNGDGVDDLIATTSSGYLYILYPSTGVVSDQKLLMGSYINFLTQVDLDSNALADYLVGGRMGGIVSFLGKDSTPPAINQAPIFLNHSSGDLELFFITNEPTTAELRYGTDPTNLDRSVLNNTLRTNQSFVLQNLNPETPYFLRLQVTDGSNNTFVTAVYSFTSPPAPPPLPLLEGLVGLLLVGTVAGVGAGIYIRRKRQLALVEGDQLLETGDYVGAIKAFYRAKRKDRIVETVTLIVQNPALSSYVSEVMELEEMEDYLTDIQEIISQTV